VTAVPPTWTILIPTLGERRALFDRLMGCLINQTDRHNGRVRVVGWHNNGSPSLPKIRQTMVQSVTTDYLSFVDDDDLVSPDYVDAVTESLVDRPDYVGFQVQCYTNGHPTAVAYHSLEYTRWRNLRGRYERDISHINPIRTAIARKVDFLKTRRGFPEDRAWADQLRQRRLLRQQVVIPRIMYHYLYSTSNSPGEGSRWESTKKISPGERSTVNHPNFSWSADA
jgi:hypothetical protein